MLGIKEGSIIKNKKTGGKICVETINHSAKVITEVIEDGNLNEWLFSEVELINNVVY